MMRVKYTLDYIFIKLCMHFKHNEDQFKKLNGKNRIKMVKICAVLNHSLTQTETVQLRANSAL